MTIHGEADATELTPPQVRLESEASPFRFRIWYPLLLLPLVAVAAFAIFQPIQVLPRIELAPGFAFVDQDGQLFTNEDLRGSLVLYTFTHTACGEGCPQTASEMGEIRRALADLETDGLALEYVTISFDPLRDSPERLAVYATELGADSGDWHFLSGEPARLKNVIGRGFGAYYQQRDDGSFAQDPMFVLVDGWGIQRARYRTAKPDIDRVQRDIGLLVTEARNRDGATRYAYEAAHLFLCYPE